jgi:pyruvate formate lyase activating enzyme
MLINGLVKSSLIDYPGKISAVIFTQGCNFRCGFCHNPDLVPINLKPQTSNNLLPNTSLGEPASGQSHLTPESEIIKFLTERVGKLDGVVITGGEPTLQSDLLGFIKKIKKMGFSVKLDTNGSNPGLLRNLITNKLINYIAMDIKNSPEAYSATCGVEFNNKIKESIDLIMQSGLDYEFRTTVLPAFHSPESIIQLAQSIPGAKKYVLQNFRNGQVLDKNLKGARSFTSRELEELRAAARRYLDNVQIRENL